MSTEYDICMAAEEALTTYLKVAPFDWCPETQIYAGIENSDTEANEGQETMRQLPCILVKCETAQAHPHLHGNWTPHVEVWVVSNRNKTTKATHRARAREVFFRLCYNAIEQNLKSASFFSARIQPTETGHIAEGSAWVSYMEFDLYGSTATEIAS